MPNVKRGKQYSFFRYKPTSSKRGLRGSKFAKAVKQSIMSALVGGATGGKAGAVGGAVGGLLEGFSSKNPSRSKSVSDAYIKKGKKRYSKKRKSRKKGKRNPSKLSVIKNGVTVNYEKRKEAVTANAEAVVIGHTSMPIKFCAINMWRAMLKFLMLKAGIYVKDYGKLLINVNFRVGDIIRVKYFNTWQSTTLLQYDVVVTTTTTFDGVAFEAANGFAGTDVEDRVTDRLESVEIIPFAGTTFVTASQIPYTLVELNSLKITVCMESLLKIQNVTTEVTADNEADDVTRVPLVGKLITVKGNNLIKKANNEIIPGFFNSVDDDCIYKGWEKQNAATASNLQYYDAAGAFDNNNTVFYKPAEIPQRKEIQGFLSENYCDIKPGAIATSRIHQMYTMTLNFYFRLLYTAGTAQRNKIMFSPATGFTKLFYLEKLVGKAHTASNDIKLWTELEVHQSALVHGPYGDYSLSIQYQIDY